MKTVGSYWPYAATLFDYIRRAMPYNDTKSLSADEVYAVSAYILSLNGVIGANDTMDAQSLPEVEMPQPRRVHSVSAVRRTRAVSDPSPPGDDRISHCFL